MTTTTPPSSSRWKEPGTRRRAGAGTRLDDGLGARFVVEPRTDADIVEHLHDEEPPIADVDASAT
jgi:hypothetical protein